MNDLNKKALKGLTQLTIVLAMSLFLPAWTIDYWQGWVFLCIFFISSLAITVYLAKKDPVLLERRVTAGPGAEKEKTQNIIQLLASISFLAIIIFPAIDHRFGWSAMSAFISLSGDVLVVAGFFIVFLVFKENSFTSAIIEVDDRQQLVSTGPYNLVRHPMYLGALVLLLGIPPALGSWWGLFTIIPITVTIIWRLLDEEKFLVKNLAGYTNYQQKVRYRLLPFVW